MAESSSNEKKKPTVGKGEIACHLQYSFCHSVFKRLTLQTRKNPELVWERVKDSLAAIEAIGVCMN